MTEDMIEEEKPSLSTRIKKFLHITSEADEGYKRKMLDGRIERYMDENFNNYIDEYGLVREIDLRKYEERYDMLVGRIAKLKEFVAEADAELGNLEHRLAEVKKAAGKKK